MSDTLPRLRMDLEFMQSPVQDRPGLLIRDPYFSDATLIVPPQMVPLLEFFDGQATEIELKQALVQATGQFDVSGIIDHLRGALDQAGFLETERFDQMRDAVLTEFAESPVKIAAHAGTAYPAEPDEFKRVFDAQFARAEAREPIPGLIGIAAPHVSPDGGWESYCDAYRCLQPDMAEKIFVVLGTSHFGEPEHFGLTRKRYLTPLGETRAEIDIITELERQAPDAVIMEDFCHASEHSIEFQVAFLQHLYGPRVRVVPILCGPFAKSLFEGGMPEDDPDVARFIGALGELHARRKQELVWVLGVDMAHIGARYGDRFAASAHQGEMLAVSARDKDRIARMESGDARGFWEQVQPNRDDLKWCGSSPFYTFLKSVPEARGRMHRYQHWQIDPQSVVSFAAMSFTG